MLATNSRASLAQVSHHGVCEQGPSYLRMSLTSSSVPKFFRWLSERYPSISQLIADNRIPEFDCLYVRRPSHYPRKLTLTYNSWT